MLALLEENNVVLFPYVFEWRIKLKIARFVRKYFFIAEVTYYCIGKYDGSCMKQLKKKQVLVVAQYAISVRRT